MSGLLLLLTCLVCCCRTYGVAPVNLNIKTAGARPYGTGTVLKGVDLEAPGNINGVPVVEVDMETFEEKPWRKPGADLSDYFNYGFNEDTWKGYCDKQKRLRMGLEVVNISSTTSKITVQQGRTGNEKEVSLPIHTSKPDFPTPASLYKTSMNMNTTSCTQTSGTIDVIGGGTATISRVEGRRRHNLEGNNIQVHTHTHTPGGKQHPDAPFFPRPLPQTSLLPHSFPSPPNASQAPPLIPPPSKSTPLSLCHSFSSPVSLSLSVSVSSLLSPPPLVSSLSLCLLSLVSSLSCLSPRLPSSLSCLLSLSLVSSLSLCLLSLSPLLSPRPSLSLVSPFPLSSPLSPPSLSLSPIFSLSPISSLSSVSLSLCLLSLSPLSPLSLLSPPPRFSLSPRLPLSLCLSVSVSSLSVSSLCLPLSPPLSLSLLLSVSFPLTFSPHILSQALTIFPLYFVYSPCLTFPQRGIC
uniref:Pre-mRNA 3'-end-processing factor FIP1 n=1 Tax=Oncorhynchus tshawytscha TaxID=74940 RepID=A0AAZ3Q829_ONCTS